MTTFAHSQLAEFDVPTRDAWLRLVEKTLKGADFEKRLVQKTADGIRIAPLYTKDGTELRAGAVAPGSLAQMLQHGGETPWEVRQLCIESDPAAANAVLHEDVAAGVAGISLRFAAPGQAGLPATHDALARALMGIDLARTTVSLNAAETGVDAAGALLAVWSAANIPADQRRAALNLDPVGDLARLGGLHQPLVGALARVAALAAEAQWREGQLTLFLADGRPYHEAGASEAIELGSALATYVCYLRLLEGAGIAPAMALPQIAVGLAADADFFLTIAKLRAVRRLLGRMAEAVGASPATHVHVAVTTSERMMARRDPWVNMLRTCAAGMGASIGGADAITILPFTWALGRPDAFARRIARNMHVILREESGIGRAADPAGGSWYLDTLTDDLAVKAWAEFQAIEATGGIEAALRSGQIKDRIAIVAADRAKALATGRAALTGVSAFPRLGPDGVEVLPSEKAAQGTGTADTVPRLAAMRPSEPFEILRDKADAARRAGRNPRVFLASLGSTAEHSGRTTWITNFLASGGIDVAAGEAFTSSADAGRAFTDSGAEIACICSSDQVYAELGEATAGVLKQAGARQVLVAGRPKTEAELKAAGADGFLFVGQDAVATLARLQRDLGIA